ncbi:MAG: hypothetical protein GY771_16785 [bacterium]|nr:hypothetical protein [bacterium]
MKRFLLISLSLTILLGVACKDPIAPEPTYFGLTPSQCIYYLEQAFNDRGISIFEIQLSPGVVFYFGPYDIGDYVNGYKIPETWDFDHIRRATWNIIRPYESGGAFDVSMDLSEGDVGAPPEGATEYTAEDISTNVLIMTDENTGILVSMGTLEFAFEKTNNREVDYWRINELRDHTGFYRKGSWSLGALLAYFYALNPLPE